MIRFCLSLVCVTLGAIFLSGQLAHSAESDPVIVKVSTKPKITEKILLGSRVRLIIDVLGRDGWANVPKLPTLEISGAIVYEPDGQSTRLNDTVRGLSFTGQRNEWWVYPRRSGKLAIPPIDVAVSIQTFDPKAAAATITKTTAAIALDVVAPDGFDAKDRDVVVTAGLTAEQSWIGDPEAMNVGDGITRSISRTIEGSPPLILPPIVFAEIQGTSRYVKQPETSIKSERGELTGRRTDSVTYVFKQKGKVILPPIEVSWFDTDADRRRMDLLEGATIVVTDVPHQSGSVASPESGGVLLRRITLSVLLCLGTIGLVLVCRHKMEAWYSFQKNTERFAFRRLQTALLSGKVSVATRALRVWIDSVYPATYLTCEQFFDAHVEADVANGLQSLYRAIDLGHADADFSLLVKSTRLARASALATHRKEDESHLSALNPTSASFP